MVFSEKDLDRIADDIDKDRRITGSVYCGNCGYNLKTLPYSYQCPECGQEYNARPLHRRGIHEPLDEEFPFAYIISAVVCMLPAGYFAAGAFRPLNVNRAAGAGCFLLAGLVIVYVIYRRLKRMAHSARISRFIAESERGTKS